MAKNILHTQDKQGELGDLVNYILRNAISDKVSDIHFDPERDGLKIRFRIDGILYPLEGSIKYPREEVISRIKVLAKMDIIEHRFPQDGHFEFAYNDKVYNIRVSTYPTIYGEALVSRILNKEEVIVSIENLGFAQDQLESVDKIVSNPYGMVLITGPTGSGKTTFLYSILNSFQREDRNIITLEDPVELELNTIRQLQINENVGLTFSRVMRSIIRQDPDIIMLGEIRDTETAQKAFQLALTGVLVFSTFHTFDVPGLIIRFIEMGVPRSVVAHALEGIISTRLVRKICSSCVSPYKLTSIEQKFLGEQAGVHNFKKGKGCGVCRNSGYSGRTGIFEVIRFDEEIRSGITENLSASAIRELLERKKVKSLKDSALEKIFQGITTTEEIIRVLGVPS